MEKKDQEAIDAAFKYSKENATVGLDYNQVYDAFLAGVKFQKERYKEPEIDYYGG